MELTSLFHSSDEQLKYVLGEGYLKNILSGKGTGKGALILTNKRIYQQGKFFEFLNRRPVRIRGTKVVDVEDVRGITTRVVKSYALAVFGFMFFGIIAIISLSIQDMGFMAIAFMALIFGIIGLATSTKYLVIDYAGGSIAAIVNWYSEADIINFRKQISLIKDEIKKEKENQNMQMFNKMMEMNRQQNNSVEYRTSSTPSNKQYQPSKQEQQTVQLSHSVQSKCSIIGLQGEYAGVSIPINIEGITLGREASASQLIFYTNNEEISRRHCHISYDQESNRFVLIDFSSNGTFLSSGERLVKNRTYYLENGDVFHLNNHKEVFKVDCS